MFRDITRKIKVGNVTIGGGAPISVQSMTNTKTQDFEATAKQVQELKDAGCDIVRVAVPDTDAAKAIQGIKDRVRIPIVADIHFDYKLALASIAAGADKIRINPGNIGSQENVRAVARACRDKGIPIRIGVNSGSVEKQLLDKYGGVTAQSLAESALNQAELLHREGFWDICISLKASDAPTTIEACRYISQRTDIPLHLGVTEAGTSYTGLVHSAVGIGTLLMDGLGDTLRVSLTADPVEEVKAGIEILKATSLRKGLRIISCPSCGRTGIDLIGTATEVENRLKGVDADITVAVMGCVVNGPGEAKNADFGLAGGKESGVIFKKGEVVETVPGDKLADALVHLIESEIGNNGTIS